MAIHIRRREFVFTLGGAAGVAARGARPAAAMPVVGFLHTGLPSDAAASRVPWSVEV